RQRANVHSAPHICLVRRPLAAPKRLARASIAPALTRAARRSGARQRRCAPPQMFTSSYHVIGFPLVQNAIASVQDFCHCSANCWYTRNGFMDAIWSLLANGQLPAGPKLGKEFSFDNIADGSGDLICSSQASIMLSIVWICILIILWICVRVV